MAKYKRSGDHYLVEIRKEEFEKVQGEIMKHNGRFTFGVGEASNHFHIAVVDKPKDMEIKKDSNGLYYFHFKEEGKLMHTEGNSDKVADHRTIPTEKKYYKQNIEIEVDIFNQTIRVVKD